MGFNSVRRCPLLRNHLIYDVVSVFFCLCIINFEGAPLYMVHLSSFVDGWITRECKGIDLFSVCLVEKLFSSILKNF
jgi:hypothetical protein